jgi:hypothetical protein
MRNQPTKPMLTNQARNLEFAGAIGGARALIQAIPSTPGPAKALPLPLNLGPLLRIVRDLGRAILPEMRAVLDLPDEQQTDELLYETLARLTWIVDVVGQVVRSGDQFSRKGRLSAKEWPPSVVREMSELVADFEELQESIALGLSAEFRKELETARAQAPR